MSNNQSPKFAYYFFACAETHLVFVDYTCKRVITHSDLENSCLGIAIFKEGKKKPTALVDPFGVFATPDLKDGLSEHLKEARERSLDHPSLDFPSQPLSDHMNYHMRRDDRWVHAPDFEHRINEATKQIKHDAMRLAKRKQAQAMIDQYGD